MATSPLIGPTDADMMLMRLDDRLRVLEQTAILPPGLVAYCAGVVPNGWLYADGSTISATRYGQLVAYLGTTTLPNLKGKVVVGRDTAGTFITQLGTGGLENVTLTAAQSGMPDHNHQVIGGLGNAGPSNLVFISQGIVNDWNNAVSNSGAANASASHTNMPPYIVLLPIIKF